MFESLEALLQRRNQQFICRQGWPDPCPPEHVVQIEHQVGPPLSSIELESLKEQLSDLPELISFYTRFSFLRLYSQVDADESAYYIAEPDKWDDLKDCFTDWIEDLDEDEKDFLPEWTSDIVVIGEIPKSGNYFVVPLTGKQSGYIYEFEHDGLEFIERGKNFAEFISKLTTVNNELIDNISGHTRYQDSRPESQWIVEEYRY